MTLQEIKMLHAYNSWATEKFITALETLPEEKFVAEMKVSFGSIHGTLTHLVGAEKIWLSRWINKPETALLSIQEAPSLASLHAIWEKVGFETAKFLGTMTDKKLLGSFTFKNIKGETLSFVYWQAVQHLVNHSSYHRGQLAAMLRQCDAVPPSTDLIRFYRETKQ